MKLIKIILFFAPSLSVQAENITRNCTGTLYNFTPPSLYSTSNEMYWEDIVFNTPTITIPKFGTYSFFIKKGDKKIWRTKNKDIDKKYNWASYENFKLTASMKIGTKKKQAVLNCSPRAYSTPPSVPSVPSAKAYSLASSGFSNSFESSYKRSSTPSATSSSSVSTPAPTPTLNPGTALQSLLKMTLEIVKIPLEIVKIPLKIIFD